MNNSFTEKGKKQVKDRIECFARRDEFSCNALTEKGCCNCKFYKHRSKIKNNPFYAYSYENKDRFMKDVKRYHIKQEQIIWE